MGQRNRSKLAWAFIAVAAIGPSAVADDADDVAPVPAPNPPDVVAPGRAGHNGFLRGWNGAGGWNGRPGGGEDDGPPAESAPPAAREAFRDLVNWVGAKVGWEFAAPDAARRRFAADAKAYADRSATLAPADAAARWLALYDRWAALPPQVPHPLDHDGHVRRPGLFADSRMDDVPPGDRALAQLMAALPAPVAWPELCRRVDARPKVKAGDARGHGLRLLSAHLSGNRPKLKKAVAAAAAAATDSGTGEQELLSVMFGDPSLADANWVTARFTAQLEPVEQHRQGVDLEHGTPGDLALPDLVGVLGKAKAEPLIRRALLSPAVVTAEDVPATRAEAQRILRQMMGRLPHPQWQLVDDGALDLYAAMDARFPVGREPTLLFQLFGARPWNTPERENARLIAGGRVLADLIARGDTAAAVRLSRASNRPTPEVPQPQSTILWSWAPRTGSYPTMVALLKDDPSLPLWGELHRSAADAGRLGDLVPFLADAERRAAEGSYRRARMGWRLADVLLAGGREDEAVAALRRVAKVDPPPELPPQQQVFNRNHVPLRPGTDPDDEEGPDQFADAGPIGSAGTPAGHRALAHQLGVLAELLHRPELAAEASAIARAHATNGVEGEEGAGYATLEAARVMSAAGRDDDAIALLADAQAKVAGARDDVMNVYVPRPPDVYELTRELVCRLVAAGRSAEALELVAKHQSWPADDLSKLLDGSVQGAELGVAVATALYDVGRAAEADKVLDATLAAGSAGDGAFALLVDRPGADPAKALARLDAVAAKDPLDDLAHAWRAECLRRLGRLDEAERAARRSIEIVPGGRATPGDPACGRAYRVLSAVLKDRGDAAGAAAADRRAVTCAIAAEGRKLFDAKLFARAAAAFAAAAKADPEYAPAHAALAAAMGWAGDGAAATPHVERAVTLMPSWLGRGMMHEFWVEALMSAPGCRTATTAAVERLAADRPADAGAQYLLSALHQAEGRNDLACQAMAKAMKLDPGWPLVAAALSSRWDLRPHLSPADRDAVVLATARADPARRWSSPDLSAVSDPRKLWAVVTAANAAAPKPVGPVFPLRGATDARRDAPPGGEPFQPRPLADGGGHLNFRTPMPWESQFVVGTAPGEALSRSPVGRAVVALLSVPGGSGEDEPKGDVP